MKRLVFILSLFIAVGCSSPKYTINGIYTPKEGEENVSFYLLDNITHDTLTTIAVKGNTFKYVGEFKEPFIAHLRATDKNIRLAKTFIVEKGTIDINLDNLDSRNNVPNTPLNMANEEIKQKRMEVTRPFLNAEKEAMEKIMPNIHITDLQNRPPLDPETQAKVANLRNRIEIEKNQALEDYFATIIPQYNNILGVDIMLQMFHAGANGRNGGIKGFIRLYELAGDYVKEYPAIKKIAEKEIPIYLAEVATQEGKMFTDFTIEKGNLDGTPAKLSDYVGKGKYILVDFWASWCRPCRAEIPFVKAVYEKYKGDNFDVLSIAIGDKREDTAVAAEKEGVVWNQIVETNDIPNKVYGIKSIPEIILFGPDGTILKRHLRGANIQAVISEALGK